MNDPSDRICVIGAGIIGMSIALALRERGRSVVLLERALPGRGISNAALGSLTPDSDEEASAATRALARESIAQYPEWLRRIRSLTGLDINYSDFGLLELAFTNSEAGGLEAKHTALLAGGAQVELWSRSQVLAAEPAISQNVVTALFYQHEPSLEVSQLLQALEMALSLTGCVVRSGQTVSNIKTSNDGKVSVSISGESIDCSAAVIASGHGLEALRASLALPLTGIRGEVIEVQGPVGYVHRHLYCGDGFIAPKRDGRLLLGSTYVEEVLPHDPTTATISVAGALSNLESTVRMTPGIANMQIVRSWRQWRARTPDGQPALGACPLPNVYLAVGLSGLGVTLAPAVARQIAILLNEGQSAALEPFSPQRFSLVKSKEYLDNGTFRST